MISSGEPGKLLNELNELAVREETYVKIEARKMCVLPDVKAILRVTNQGWLRNQQYAGCFCVIKNW